MRRSRLGIVTWIALMGVLPFTETAALALPPGPASEVSLATADSPRTSLLDAPGSETVSDIRGAGSLRFSASNAFLLSESRLHVSQQAVAPPTPAAAEERVVHRKTADLYFWSVTGVLIASTVANAQAYVNCSNCTALPSAFHRSGVLYGVGLPLDVGFASLGFYLKKTGHRWWAAPGAAFAGGNTYLAYHWASRTQ